MVTVITTVEQTSHKRRLEIDKRDIMRLYKAMPNVQDLENLLDRDTDVLMSVVNRTSSDTMIK